MRALTTLRWPGFVLMNTGTVALYLEWLTRALPPPETEGRELVVLPGAAIALVAFTLLYPQVVRAETHAARLGLLVLATASGITAYTAFVWRASAAPSPPCSRPRSSGSSS